MIEIAERLAVQPVESLPGFDELPEYERRLYSELIISGELPVGKQVERAHHLVFGAMVKINPKQQADLPVLARVSMIDNKQVLEVGFVKPDRECQDRLQLNATRLNAVAFQIKNKTPVHEQAGKDAVEVIDRIAKGDLFPKNSSLKFRMPEEPTEQAAASGFRSRLAGMVKNLVGVKSR